MVSSLCMYYFDMNFRKYMLLDHRDVMPVYRGSVLDFRTGPLSQYFLVGVFRNLLLKVMLAFSGVIILSQSGEIVISPAP